VNSLIVFSRWRPHKPRTRHANNHFPIQKFYLQEVVKKADGSFEIKTVATILKDHQDRYHDKCPMK
jgi:branched-chain amino acid transport system substrate-binding protein